MSSDSSKMQSKTIAGYEYEVPASWKEGDSTDTIYYFYPEDGMLMVGYSEMDLSISDETVRKDFLEGFASNMGNCELLGESEITIANSVAYRQELNIELDDKNLTASMVNFDCTGGVISFLMATEKTSAEDYSNDYDAILKSIKNTNNEPKNTPETENKVSNTEDTLKQSNSPSQELSLNYIFFPENMRWEMALAEVEDMETHEQAHNLESSGSNYLSYKTTVGEEKYASRAEIVYLFENNQLKARWCQYDKSLSDFRSVYNELKATISAKHGECESEDIVWTDSTYQNDESKWNDAFRYGYVTIKTVWHTSDSAIVIKWDYNSAMYVAFSVIGFENSL